jgi:hypothetical protein
LKFFEPALVDTLTVASPSFTMRGCITSGQNGYLCREDEWYDTLRQIYLDLPAQQALVDHARRYALERYAGPAMTARIEAAYNAFV